MLLMEGVSEFTRMGQGTMACGVMGVAMVMAGLFIPVVIYTLGNG
jgi:hypothetical protein